ncbi:HAMP domain-containing histidine kinase [Pseudomonas protegens]|uniref:sensor histidine kinase n=1 Tax=Pseudomonas protegens TaxID=380021 RepID=UPI001C8E33BB|nr:HAMP domain-containing sensor histidine kinase [Pseudomonas protegens]QZI67917.1 HAMP domain-containing histidine kinase [Pseudomonas protegens]
MNEVNGKTDQSATAARELLLLGQKIVQARAVLASLQKELGEANTRVGDSQYIEQLIEANQQLVQAILLAQSNAQEALRIQQEQPLNLDMREANEQLVIAALSAQHLQTTAEQLLEQQRHILVLVAHELRHPLTPISMIAGRLTRVPSEELPRMQALIEGQVQHMSRLVDDLLDVSRVSTGKLHLDRQVLDLRQIVDDAIETCRPLMKARHLHFCAQRPDDPLPVEGDPVRLKQILGNLLGNAAKYTPAEGQVTLSVSARDDAVQLTVCDNGIGISAKALPFIFEPFIQDAHAIGFNGAGLGIGLTVVRELVEAHGGTVQGMSEGSGKGSRFVVILPLVSDVISTPNP